MTNQNNTIKKRAGNKTKKNKTTRTNNNKQSKAHDTSQLSYIKRKTPQASQLNRKDTKDNHTQNLI